MRTTKQKREYGITLPAEAISLFSGPSGEGRGEGQPSSGEGTAHTA